MFPCVQKLRVGNDASRRAKQTEPAKPDSSGNVDTGSTSGVQHVSHEDVLKHESTNGAESGDDLDSPELHSILSPSSSSSSSSSDAADTIAGSKAAEPVVMATESSDEVTDPVDDASNDDVQTATDAAHVDDDDSHTSTAPETGRSILLHIDCCFYLY